MNEIKNPEINEIKKPEHNNYKEIKSEKGTTADMARSFWNNEFKKETEYYNSYEDRLSCKPVVESGQVSVVNRNLYPIMKCRKGKLL